MSKIIEVKDLCKHFTYYKKEAGFRNSLRNLFFRQMLTKEAVKGISFSIEEGEMVGFLGPNGAGKTTTLKMLSGILYPTSGQATVMGYIPWERQKALKQQFSIVMGQKNQLWWDLPANESLLLNKYIYGIDNKEYERTVDELTELLDVKDILSIQVRRLSLGERMKLELIASLIHKPKVIFLDEPTIGLDVISQLKIREFLKAYNQEHKLTVLLTSHYMDDIQDLCKRSIIINQGQVVFDGSLHNVSDIFNKKLIKMSFSDQVAKEQLNSLGMLTSYDGISATLEINRNELKETSKTIMDNFPIEDFTIENIPIEAAVTWLYQKGES